jgi:hypothetical protein
MGMNKVEATGNERGAKLSDQARRYCEVNPRQQQGRNPLNWNLAGYVGARSGCEYLDLNAPALERLCQASELNFDAADAWRKPICHQCDTVRPLVRKRPPGHGHHL